MPIDEHRRALLLFWLCWLVYFATNLGRLSYTSSVAIVLQKEGFTSAAGGLISMGFFLCYGAGQLFNGYVGDRVRPKSMILLGLLLTAACNALFCVAATSNQMLMIWCVNGIAQSMLWPPLLRVLAEKLPATYQKKACTHIATTYPAATLVCYALSSVVSPSQHWQVVFWAAVAMLLCSAACWFAFYDKLAGCPADGVREGPARQATQQEERPRTRDGYPVMVLLLFFLALMVQGALRDGVMTWIPALLADTFQVSVASATLSMTIMPFVNMIGVYGANLLYRKLQNEAGVSAMLFAIACAFALVLANAQHMILSVGAFGLIAACMMGINLMLVSFVPTYFASRNKVALISGMTNAMVYVGSSVSVFGFGSIADVKGWASLFNVFIGLALVGMALTGLAIPLWRKFQRREVV